MTRMHVVVLYLTGIPFWADGCTQSSWSNWINDNKPTSGPSGGEYENMNMTERYRFCAPGHGSLTNIDCTSENGVNYNRVGLSSSALSCRVDRGMSCKNNLLSTGICVDFRIRLYCTCTDPITTSTVRPSISTNAKRTSVGRNPSTLISGGGSGGSSASPMSMAPQTHTTISSGAGSLHSNTVSKGPGPVQVSGSSNTSVSGPNTGQTGSGSNTSGHTGNGYNTNGQTGSGSNNSAQNSGQLSNGTNNGGQNGGQTGNGSNNAHNGTRGTTWYWLCAILPFLVSLLSPVFAISGRPLCGRVTARDGVKYRE